MSLRRCKDNIRLMNHNNLILKAYSQDKESEFSSLFSTEKSLTKARGKIRESFHAQTKNLGWLSEVSAA